MKTIKEVKVGETIDSPKNGLGMVVAKTARTVTVQFQNGNKSKITYRYSDAYFYESDF